MHLNDLPPYKRWTYLEWVAVDMLRELGGEFRSPLTVPSYVGMKWKDRLTIQWRGNVVGYLVEPKFDNFELYGRWLPVPGDAAARFLLEFERGEDVEVTVGPNGSDQIWTVTCAPESEISLKLSIKMDR